MRLIFRLLSLSLALTASISSTHLVHGTTSFGRTDVVVIGATPAGIAAALSAARSGAHVILIEETSHVGGIISGGLTNADIGKIKAVGGLYNEFRRRIRQFYATKYGEDSQQVKDCRDGRNVEPHVAEKIFVDMLAEHRRVRLITEHYLAQARVHDNQIEAVVVHDAKNGNSLTIAGKIFIDATYEGDLAAKAGVPYRIGRESRAEYGESLAGRIYTNVGTREILPGSTGEGDAGIQAFCFRIHVTSDPANRVPFTKPADYRRDDYRYLLADIKAGRITQIRQIIQFYLMPNEKYELNSNHVDPVTRVPSESFDLAEDNWKWPEASRSQRRRMLSRYWTYHEGLLWFLQHDTEVPETLRREMTNFGFCRDEFVDNKNRPYLLYVREGRRIYGEYNFTQREEDPDPETSLPRLHADSIAVVSYNWDSHSVHKYDPRFPGAREGYFLAPHPPLQVPYGVIVPKKINGLLVPVACSASHVGYQTIRMEPVFMALAQTAGIAAAQAVRLKVEVRNIPVAIIQAELTHQQGVIAYFEDVPLDHPAFAAIQFLGPREFSRDFNATPDRVLNQKDAAERLARILKAFGRSWQRPPVTDTPLSGAMLVEWLKVANVTIQTKQQEDVLVKKELTVGDFALAVAGSLTAGSLNEDALFSRFSCLNKLLYCLQLIERGPHRNLVSCLIVS